MRKIELLAPAGNEECLKAAVQAGADAVYLGIDKFNARIRANNFNEDNLEEAVDYAHLRDVKTYLTLNTLIRNDELEELYKILDLAYKIGVDGIIVQDLAVASYIRDNYKEMALHASTQMTVYDNGGLEFLKKLGFNRAVIGRETKIENINKITKDINLETEIFIHGALCFCYSGQCLMSSFIGGRSGNRGECAQPCRQEYELFANNTKREKINGNYLLSMKDLCTIEHLKEIIKSNVTSLKIEGRMKGPEYVYSVVESYRNVIDSIIKGKKLDKDIYEYVRYMSKVFNRGNFTKGFLFSENRENITNNEKPNNCGVSIGKVTNISKIKDEIEININESISVGDVLECFSDRENDYKSFKITKILKDKRRVGLAYKGETVWVNSKHKFKENTNINKVYDANLMKKINTQLKNDSKKREISCKFYLKKSEYPNLKVFYGDYEINQTSDILPQKAISKAMTKDKIVSQIKKTKSTTFVFKEVDISIDEGLVIQISEINKMRREALNKLRDIIIEKSKRKVGEKANISIKLRSMEEENLINIIKRDTNTCVQFLNWKSKYDLTKINAKKFYLPIEYFLENTKEKIIEIKNRKIEIYIWIPVITKEKYWKIFKEKIDDLLKEKIIDGCLVSNYCHINKLVTGNIFANYNFNIFNNKAIEEFEKLGVKGLTYSTELNIDQIERLDSKKMQNEIVTYGRLPVMYSDHCLKKDFNLSCLEQNLELKDRLGFKFPLLCDKLNCVNIILNSKIIYLKNNFDILKRSNVDWVRILITIESQKEVEDLVDEHN
ncbi:MAG: DUF3656 domain-containing protein, partial [Clostridiales bacterium]